MKGSGNLVLALKAKLKVPWEPSWGPGSQVGALVAKLGPLGEKLGAL